MAALAAVAVAPTALAVGSPVDWPSQADPGVTGHRGHCLAHRAIQAQGYRHARQVLPGPHELCSRMSAHRANCVTHQ